jgi:DNA mismatch repair protein PMS2
MFNKKDFLNLEIIGQFNKGFILALLRDRGDLFIVDQHASDEKFNFELLSRTTKMHAQDLVCPIEVPLSITDALVVS